ncbi:hypothetical protein Glove_135g20 [Diversispora epigaea]|uniref:Uncharacterized protein n=1 Tax=Diversispora epigaea TaxID=1348612 RepID=A0A397J606_9GLOM|nr:hypothetical protein Glove_135g20 [Diversispora epigaea]
MYLIPNQLQVLLLNYNGNETILMKFSSTISPSAKAPNWAYNEQEDVVYDTEFVQTEGEDKSSFLKHLLRNVLDPQSASSTTAQLQWKRNYSDEIQHELDNFSDDLLHEWEIYCGLEFDNNNKNDLDKY